MMSDAHRSVFLVSLRLRSPCTLYSNVSAKARLVQNGCKEARIRQKKKRRPFE